MLDKFTWQRYNDEEFVQTVSAQIPWSHNTVILDKVKDADQRMWYIQKTTENGWSHNVLIHQIESGLYERQVLAGKIANFENRLASPQSELALQTMKDPYIFDFIPFSEDMDASFFFGIRNFGQFLNLKSCYIKFILAFTLRKEICPILY